MSSDNTQKLLGWVVWVCVLVLVVMSLGDIRKGGVKRRVAMLFDAIAVPLLLLTVFTQFSKFHLLWIIPIAMGCCFVAMVWWSFREAAAKQNVMEQEIRKAAAKVPPLKLPLFGDLTWDGIESWEGEICLPAWVGFQSRGGAYGAENSETPSDGTARMLINPATPESPPSDPQHRGLQFQIDEGTAVVQSVLAALSEYYKDLKESWKDDFPDMPPVPQHPAAFKGMFGLHQIHIHPLEKDGMAYVGLEFGCDWDEEHGLGIILHGAKVIEIGQADTSFCWQPDETASQA
jgi:hypothetical protein